MNKMKQSVAFAENFRWLFQPCISVFPEIFSRKLANQRLANPFLYKLIPTDCNRYLMEYAFYSEYIIALPFSSYSRGFANKSTPLSLSLTGSLSRLPKNGSFGVSLKVLQCEVFTISPVHVYDKNVEFAPIGLIQMYNSGGAVEDIDFSNKNSDLALHIEGRGSGLFGAYASRQPKICTLNSRQEEFKFNMVDNLLTLNIPTGVQFWELDILF